MTDNNEYLTIKQDNDTTNSDLDTDTELEEIMSSTSSEQVVDKQPMPELPTETVVEEPVIKNEQEYKIKLYDQEVYNQAMDTVVTLMSGMKFTKSNWMILLNKITAIVKGVKSIDNRTRVQLIYDLLMNYLDHHTSLSDDIIDFINKNAKYTCEFMLEQAGVNKREHQQNNRGLIQQYQLYAADTDAMINTLQITNLLVNKVTVLIKDGTMKDINMLQRKVPDIVMTCVKVVDKFKHLTTAEKSSLIAQAIEEVLENEVLSKLDEDDQTAKTALELLILNLPMMITTVTGVVNGDIDFVEDIGSAIKRGWNRIKKSFSCCSCGKHSTKL